MAEAMLGKYKRSSSSEILLSRGKHKRSLYSVFKEKYPDRKDNVTLYNASDDRPECSSDKTCEKRGVVIQTPPKRQRIVGNYSAVDIVHALNRAVTKNERIEALENAIATFDHNNRDLHDAEIEVGADVALVKNLVFLQFKASFRREQTQCDVEDISQEIGSVLKCLECVYRASSDAVGKSFNRVGNDLLRVLLVLIDDQVKSRRREGISSSLSEDSKSSRRKVTGTNEGLQQADILAMHATSHQDGSSQAHDILLQKSTKIIGHFARVGRATRPMARFPGFLGSILDLCNIRPFSTIPFEARLSCLWAIANLACNTDNMAMMMSTPSLVESLIAISNRRPSSNDNLETVMEIIRAKSIASRTILNLSWSPENKNLMSENVALVQALCRVALERQAPYKHSKTMQNILVQTRRHSLASLRNISAVSNRGKVALCAYHRGKLLDVLTDVVLNETDPTVLGYSFSAIHNLTIPDTAEAIVDRAALVLALKNVLLEATDDFEEGKRHSKKCQCASATILVLERAITPDKPSYENFRELLDTINPSNPSESTDEAVSLNATAV
eukprot:CAMPEP_0172383972 /NCGR_PEP_ID=MMETSP1061-20121228/1780_1 /TAXON_ID=37318 /ORGANISM="Pseudo-nitzschia pungens, Strain cf. pungens" /LENGTH=558 /DNA_ID=CAMNT_0013112435 /DNA_START=189 /DNA_END=1865 /DNA_ORIENTATION=+